MGSRLAPRPTPGAQITDDASPRTASASFWGRPPAFGRFGLAVDWDGSEDAEHREGTDRAGRAP